jgi:hypothetical protein
MKLDYNLVISQKQTDRSWLSRKTARFLPYGVPGQNPLHSEGPSTSMSPSMLTGALDLPLPGQPTPVAQVVDVLAENAEHWTAPLLAAVRAAVPSPSANELSCLLIDAPDEIFHPDGPMLRLISCVMLRSWPQAAHNPHLRQCPCAIAP